MQEKRIESVKHIDGDIESYGKMGFLNENLLVRGSLMVEKSKEELFEHVKVRKFVSVKVDVSQELQQASGIAAAHNVS